MEINLIGTSYINVSGNIYDSEFINLANVKDDKIALDERTIFLKESKKQILNNQEIKRFDDAVYIFKYNNTYGMICDLPIKEYTSGKVKCHELVLPDTVQGMLSNLHGYNCEVAPILLGHEKNIDYLSYIKSGEYIDSFIFDDIEVYVFCGNEAEEILEEFEKIQNLYVADGHHRLYTTSISNFKESVLSCLISFDYFDILPIHRIIQNIDVEIFKQAKEFIHDRFEILPSETMLEKGKVCMRYNGNSFVVSLIDLNSDAFWNNDIYRLNTQIISQAFRIFDTGQLKYISNDELEEDKFVLEEKDVLIETYPVSKHEFIESANNNCIMPPKSTWFSPKFPSFLIFKQYK